MPKYKLTKVDEFPALGGYPNGMINQSMKNEGYGATSPGVFTVEKIVPHRSYGRWTNSAVPWNTETKIVRNNNVMVKMGGVWTKVSTLPGWKGMTQQECFNHLLASYDELFNKGTIGAMRQLLNLDRKGILNLMKVPYLANSPTGKEIPSKWLLNDFGHKSIKFFRDKNNDGIRNGKEKGHAQFMHSSPSTEVLSDVGSSTRGKFKRAVFQAATAKTKNGKIPDFDRQYNNGLLGYSHGCIHIFPNDIDIMVSKGYIKKSSIIQVHGYHEKTKPMLVVDRSRTSNFEVHFYPKDAKAVVYKSVKERNNFRGGISLARP